MIPLPWKEGLGEGDKMDTILERYKDDRSAVIQALQDTQNAYGYISQEHLKQISTSTGTPYSYTYAIATFYRSFSLKERGKYIISVCDGTACHLKLSEDLLDEIQQYLGIGIDDHSTSARFHHECGSLLARSFSTE